MSRSVKLSICHLFLIWHWSVLLPWKCQFLSPRDVIEQVVAWSNMCTWSLPTQINLWFCEGTLPHSLPAHTVLSLVCLQVMRHYNNIEDDATICPSWCLTVRLRAHTYEAKQEHIIPQYILDVPKVCDWPLDLCRDTQCSELFTLSPIALRCVFGGFLWCGGSCCGIIVCCFSCISFPTFTMSAVLTISLILREKLLGSPSFLFRWT